MPSSDNLGPENECRFETSQESLMFVAHYRQMRILCLLCLLSISLFFFVVLPIILNLPYYSEPWLNVGDPWKMVDPLITLPLFYFILVTSPLYSLPSSSSAATTGGQWNQKYKVPLVQSWLGTSLENSHISHRTLILLLFLIGAAICIEGHGLHTAMTMVKDPIKALYTQRPEILTAYPEIMIIYNYIRDDWQHLYSHYIYVVGVLMMMVSHMLAWKDAIHRELDGLLQWSLFIVGSLVFGILFAGVSINFPSGLVVGWLWIFVYGGGWSVYLFIKRDRAFEGRRLLFSRGNRLIIQWYLLSYMISLVIMIVYVSIYGWKDRASANIPLK